MTKDSQNQYSHIHTVGNYAGSRPVFMGIRRKGDCMLTYGWIPNEKVLNQSDMFYFMNVRTQLFIAVREIKLFAVMEDVMSDACGRALIYFCPNLITKEINPDRKTVNRAPLKGEHLIIVGESGSQYQITFDPTKVKF